ncbi:MAG: hypothetical protein CMK89_00780 [Pseudomonadales bacterium]|nr:hypothetical protein [Pseudomonadales bacterium]RLU03471.1 MAG: hypothetical protein D9N11_03980 [Ketobacter sp.]
MIDTATTERVAGQIGSNPAGVYMDAQGKRYYVKTLETSAHARNEWIAAMLYRLAGAPTLTYLPTAAPDQIATEWVELDKRYISHFTAAERKQAQQWFGVHAWTANWDAAGLEGDNQGVLGKTVLTLDVGGALAYRAHGDPKGNAFGTEVTELELLRTDTNNPYAIRLFGDMTAGEILRSVGIVTRIPDAMIRSTIHQHGGSEKLVEKMLARKATMAHF